MKRPYTTPVTEIVILNLESIADATIPVGPGTATSEDAMAKQHTGVFDIIEDEAEESTGYTRYKAWEDE